MKYILVGNPIALARPRLSGKNVYDSQKHLKNDVALQLLNQHAGRPFYEGPVEFHVSFYLPISKSTGTILKRSKLENRLHTSRPDLSNLLKFVEDVGNGIIYKDDAIITKITAEKRYSLEPRTELIVTEAV